MKGKLILEDNSEFEGVSFGAGRSIAGEVVFSTGMVGYPQAYTDPSFKGQILIQTYPLIGNYGVANPVFFESDNLQISGLVVSDYIDTPSHFQSERTLAKWLKDENIPALIIKDTRSLTQKIREKGVMLGKIVFDKDVELHDPNTENLVAQVSTKEIKTVSQRSHLGQGATLTQEKNVLLIDCGAKRNIARCLTNRGVQVTITPWDYNPFLAFNLKGLKQEFDGIVISNGPGDPKMADKTIATIQKALTKNVPILGICLGHQLLALAAGGDTRKLKYGHRSQNQPCILQNDSHSGKPKAHPESDSGQARMTETNENRCYITTQNHGFEVYKVPKGFKSWFTNANDGSNEGIIHETLPIMSVQFHPEATPGPVDTEWIFDFFLEKIQ